MPQTSYRSGKHTVYKDIFHPITAQARQELYGAVLELYEQARAEEAMKNAEEVPAQGASMFRDFAVKSRNIVDKTGGQFFSKINRHRSRLAFNP